MTSLSILPFEINIEMRTYQRQAFPLGIAKANIKDYGIWLCQKLILNHYNRNKPTLLFDIYEEDLLSEHDGFITTESITNSALNTIIQNQELIEHNKSMIRQGCYISGGFNEFYIPQKWPFGKYHFDHDYLIYGYNDNSRVFYSAGYLENGRFDHFSVSYDDYLLGVINQQQPDRYINYHKANSLYRPTLTTSNMKNKLLDYIYSRCSCKTDCPDEVYGIDGWQMLACYVQEHKHTTLDVRYGRLFSEHRYLMLERMRILHAQGILKETQLINDYHDLVYLPARVVFLLFLKYNQTLNEAIPTRIINLVNEIIQSEVILLNTFINHIVDDEVG